MKFIPTPALQTLSPQTMPFLIEIGVVKSGDGMPLCKICEIVEEREPDSSVTFACLPVQFDNASKRSDLFATLLSNQEFALFDADDSGRILRNIAYHTATRFNYETGVVEESGDQKRNVRVLYHRDVVSLITHSYIAYR